MSFWEGIGGALGGGLVSEGVNRLFGGDSEGWSSSKQIRHATNMADALYPGTTPYERLLSGGGGAPQASSAGVNADASQRIAENQRRQQRDIIASQLVQADMKKEASEYQADATAYAAELAAGKMGFLGIWGNPSAATMGGRDPKAWRGTENPNVPRKIDDETPEIPKDAGNGKPSLPGPDVADTRENKFQSFKNDVKRILKGAQNRSDSKYKNLTDEEKSMWGIP